MDQSHEKILLQRIEKAIDLIEQSELEEGMNLLKLCEAEILSSDISDSDLLLLIFHNLSLCSQVLQDFEDCNKYLKKTIKSAKSRTNTQEIDKIRNTRYISMLLIQQAAALSHLGEHEESINASKQAFNFISQSFSHCIQAASTKDLPSPSFQNCKTLETCLLYLSGKILKFPSNCSQIIQRSSLGVVHFTDWIYSFSMNDILDIKPLRFFELKNAHTLLAEFFKDFMLEKVCLLLTSCYLIATETRQLSDLKEVKKAKNWHLKAVEIGTVLIPMETPLLQHIKSSFDKHYPQIVIQPVKSKAKTPGKGRNIVLGKNKTPNRQKPIQRKIIKEIEVKTDRSYVRDKIKGMCDEMVKYKTQREENQEPEPPISEDYDQHEVANSFIISSNDLYGIHTE